MLKRENSANGLAATNQQPPRKYKTEVTRLFLSLQNLRIAKKKKLKLIKCHIFRIWAKFRFAFIATADNVFVFFFLYIFKYCVLVCATTGLSDGGASNQLRLSIAEMKSTELNIMNYVLKEVIITTK